MDFLKKNWFNILFIAFIVLLFIPQTRKPIQIGLNRLIAFSPSTVSEDKRENLESYNWSLRDLEGRPANLNRSIGRVAVINMWATWCPPCIAEMPSFQKLYNDYGEKVDFYFVSSEEAGKLRSFMEDKTYRLPVYQPISMPPAKMRSRSLPTTYVLSKGGEIVVDKKGSANWNDAGFRKTLDALIEAED